jgi:hypothetical protein
MAFADSTDGWITRHLPDMVEIEGKHQRIAAHTCGGQTGLDSSMASANHDNIVNLCLCHRFT